MPELPPRAGVHAGGVFGDGDLDYLYNIEFFRREGLDERVVFVLVLVDANADPEMLPCGYRMLGNGEEPYDEEYEDEDLSELLDLCEHEPNKRSWFPSGSGQTSVGAEGRGAAPHHRGEGATEPVTEQRPLLRGTVRGVRTAEPLSDGRSSNVIEPETQP